MRSLCGGRGVLGICAAVVTLAGCGGGQSPIGAPSFVPEGPKAATHGYFVVPEAPFELARGNKARGGRSWMLPEARREDLLYADSSGGSVHDIYVFSYPKGKLVGTISEPDAAYQQGLCVNGKGDVFVTTLSINYYGGAVYEYAHGGTKPVEILYEQGVWPWGCGVDPSSGNLAVASINLECGVSWVEVYQHARGEPEDYYDREIINYTFAGYDDEGNLFVDGSGSGSNVEFGELAKGSGTLINVNLDRNINCCGQVQWDGKHITIEDEQAGAIYRLKFSGSTGTVIGTTRLEQWTDGAAQSWIENNAIVQPNGESGTEIESWRYPAGGKPTARIAPPAAVFGVTFSQRP